MRSQRKKKIRGVQKEKELEKKEETYRTGFSLKLFAQRVKKLNNSQKDAIRRVGFGGLLEIHGEMVSRHLLHELLQRWDVEKRVFVFPQGELTISLMDVALILGLRVVGTPIVVGEEEQESKVKVKILNDKFDSDSLLKSDSDEFVRKFLLFTVSTILFPNPRSTINSRYTKLFHNLEEINQFAWGAAVLDEVVHWLSEWKKGDISYIGGCLIFLQMWCLEHINIGRPSLMYDNSSIPRAGKWRSVTLHNREWFAAEFEKLKDDQITWRLVPTSDESKVDIIRELVMSQMVGPASHIVASSDPRNQSNLVGGVEIASENASGSRSGCVRVRTTSGMRDGFEEPLGHSLGHSLDIGDGGHSRSLGILMANLEIAPENQSGGSEARLTYGLRDGYEGLVGHSPLLAHDDYRRNLMLDLDVAAEGGSGTGRGTYSHEELSLGTSVPSFSGESTWRSLDDDNRENNLEKENRALRKKILELEKKLGNLSRENLNLKKENESLRSQIKK